MDNDTQRWSRSDGLTVWHHNVDVSSLSHIDESHLAHFDLWYQPCVQPCSSLACPPIEAPSYALPLSRYHEKRNRSRYFGLKNLIWLRRSCTRISLQLIGDVCCQDADWWTVINKPNHQILAIARRKKRSLVMIHITLWCKDANFLILQHLESKWKRINQCLRYTRLYRNQSCPNPEWKWCRWHDPFGLMIVQTVQGFVFKASESKSMLETTQHSIQPHMWNTVFHRWRLKRRQEDRITPDPSISERRWNIAKPSLHRGQSSTAQ